MRLTEFVNESSQVDPYEVVVEVYSRSFPFLREYMKSFRVGIKTPLLFSGRHEDKPIFTKSIRKDRYPKDSSPEAHNFMDEVFYKLFRVRARSESIFVTGKAKEAKNYGNNVYGIFPNGMDYKIIWSPRVQDIYAEMVDTGDYSNIGRDPNELAGDMAEEDTELEEDVRDRLGEMFEDEHTREDFLDDDDIFDEDMYIDARDEYIVSNFDYMMRDMASEKAREIIEYEEDNFESEIKKHYKEGDLKNAIYSMNEIMLSGKSYTAVRYDYLPYLMRYMEVNGTKKPTPKLFAECLVGFDPSKFPHVSGQKSAFKMSRLSKEILSILDISDLKQGK